MQSVPIRQGWLELCLGLFSCTVVRPGQIYRCDSQGTVNTSALSDSGSTTPTLTDTSDLVHFSSDSSGYEVLATTTTAKINDGLGSFSVHAECGGGALSEPETLPTLLRRRRNQQHCHHRHRRRPSRRYQRTLVVVKQPKIDLEKMMVVPFSNKTPVSMADPGALESVAVQTSPPGEEKKPGTIAKEGASRRRASSQSGIGSMFRGKIKPLNRLGRLCCWSEGIGMPSLFWWLFPKVADHAYYK